MNSINSLTLLLLSLLLCLAPIPACRHQPTGTVYTSTHFTPLPGDAIQMVSGLMVQITLDDLVNQSDTIVIGKVIEIREPRWTNEHFGPRTIYTDVIIKPERFLYGFKMDQIAVRVLGGRTGATAMIVEDQPVFNSDEEMLLFLSRPVDLNLVVPEGIEFTDYYNVTGSLQGEWSYIKGRVTDLIGNTQDIAAVEARIAELKPEALTTSKFEIPSHEGTPLIYMERNYLMQGKVAHLSIYEDGTVTLTEDLNLRMPIASIVPMRYWFTGRLDKDELSKLIQDIGTSGILDMSENNVAGGYSMSDMGLTIQTSFEGAMKKVTSMGYFGAEDLPGPLGDVYARLIGVTYDLEFVGSQAIK
jgi:hypothetical protein